MKSASVSGRLRVSPRQHLRTTGPDAVVVQAEEQQQGFQPRRPVVAAVGDEQMDGEQWSNSGELKKNTKRWLPQI